MRSIVNSRQRALARLRAEPRAQLVVGEQRLQRRRERRDVADRHGEPGDAVVVHERHARGAGRVETTGVPAACASICTRPNASLRATLGRQKTSAA